MGKRTPAARARTNRKGHVLSPAFGCLDLGSPAPVPILQNAGPLQAGRSLRDVSAEGAAADLTYRGVPVKGGHNDNLRYGVKPVDVAVGDFEVMAVYVIVFCYYRSAGECHPTTQAVCCRSIVEAGRELYPL